jgi:hypothetical protein
VVHGDIGPGNLLIDPETDNLLVFDFNWSERLSHPDYEVDRNDVKYVTLTLYEIITRDLHFREENYPEELDSSMWRDMETWGQHAEVRLDSGILDYRQVLEHWVKSREETDKHTTLSSQLPNFIYWPPVPKFPLVPWVGSMSRRPAQMRSDLVKRGASFLKWERPGSNQLPLPSGQRLLATGEIVNEDKELPERS